MKKKIIIILAVITAVLALLFCGYRLGMSFVEDKAVDMLLKDQINDMIDSGEVTLEELEEILNIPDEGEETENIQQSEGVAENGNGETQPEKDITAEDEPSPPAQKPVTSQEPDRQEVVEKAGEKIEDRISREDKRAIMRLIGSRLTSSDISYLSGLLKGGLSSAEKKEAKKIALSRFSSAEMQEIKGFYRKYIGLIKKEK